MDTGVGVAEDSGAGADSGHLGDGDVAGEGMGVGAEAPDMQVVDVFDAVDGCQCAANLNE